MLVIISPNDSVNFFDGTLRSLSELPFLEPKDLIYEPDELNLNFSSLISGGSSSI